MWIHITENIEQKMPDTKQYALYYYVYINFKQTKRIYEMRSQESEYCWELGRQTPDKDLREMSSVLVVFWSLIWVTAMRIYSFCENSASSGLDSSTWMSHRHLEIDMFKPNSWTSSCKAAPRTAPLNQVTPLPSAPSNQCMICAFFCLYSLRKKLP